MYEGGRRGPELVQCPNAHSHCHYLTTSDTMYNELSSARAAVFMCRYIKPWPQKTMCDMWTPCPRACLCLWCNICEWMNLRGTLPVCQTCVSALPLTKMWSSHPPRHTNTQTGEVVLWSRRAYLFSFMKTCIHFSHYPLCPGGDSQC